MSKALLMIALLGMASVTLAKTNSSVLRSKACAGRGDCGEEDDEGGMDLIKSDPPTKPSSDLEGTLESLENWNEYLDKMVNPNPMAAASERAAMLSSALKRKHDEQERNLADSNQQLRMSTKSGLMQVLSKFAVRWAAEQRLSAEADKRAAELQSIRDKKKRLDAQAEQLRALSSASGDKAKPVNEQLADIVEAAKANQETPDNKDAFEWLTSAVKGYKPAAAAPAAPAPKA